MNAGSKPHRKQSIIAPQAEKAARASQADDTWLVFTNQEGGCKAPVLLEVLSIEDAPMVRFMKSEVRRNLHTGR